MPLYEYVCEDCGYRFEALQRFSDEPLKKCPKCGGRLRKVLSPPAIQFKGSGWYVTDYKNKNNGGNGHKSSVSNASKKDSQPPQNKPQNST